MAFRFQPVTSSQIQLQLSTTQVSTDYRANTKRCFGLICTAGLGQHITANSSLLNLYLTRWSIHYSNVRLQCKYFIQLTA
jgi:hypothetical protein